MSLDDARRVRRRFIVLSATRWFPVGLLIPVLTVLLQERGMTVATIGLLSGLSSAMVVLFELPTGGLADTIGRRPVLLVAGLLSLLSMSLISFSEATWLFVLAWAIEGVYRALDSGPLESWFVDAAQAADVDADIESGLAAESVVISAALGGGALLGGVLALVPTPSAWPALALPIVVAIVLRIVDLAFLWHLLDESRARPAGSGWSPIRDSARTIRDAIGLLRVSGALCALAAIELFWGAGMTGVEILSGLRMVDLVGDTEQGVLAYAVTAAVAWGVSGAGAAVAPWVARRTGSWVRAAIVARIAQGVGVALAVVIAGPIGLVLGYLGFYLVHGTANVAHYGLVHRHTTAAHRATMVSVNSLTSRLGGMVAAPALGALAGGQGLVAGFAVSAVLLVLSAPLYLFASRGRTAEPLGPVAQIDTQLVGLDHTKLGAE
ncbi:hypothetical protein GCM10009547_12280 [Sporichthya brevicatena]|uniref:Major facilitator superfamily (MFS) profile domain-containing protein n=1 Tax=Sporichthya brevicatena TaxID=171442 RepID=A0ABN1GHP5_9ACTN